MKTLCSSLAVMIVSAVFLQPAAASDRDADYEKARHRMVLFQIEQRDISDQRVLEAMRTVPRHLFVPEKYRDQAYRDYPLPIGSG